jgi:Histidinol phosphatase and related hydrolases of the PHP family
MLKIDLHIHTIASGHAQNTILEFINQAKKLKMKVIGISDHGPGSKEEHISRGYFQTLDRLPETINGIRVLKGVEANIINENGELDVGENETKHLDYVMANFHDCTGYENQGIEKNTASFIRAIKSGKINIITHPTFTEPFTTDLSALCAAACENNVLLELNLARLNKKKIEPNTIANIKTMIAIAKKYGKKIIIGSDSHNIWELADDSLLIPIKEEIGLTDDLIINNYPQELFQLLKIEK